MKAYSVSQNAQARFIVERLRDALPALIKCKLPGGAKQKVDALSRALAAYDHIVDCSPPSDDTKEPVKETTKLVPRQSLYSKLIIEFTGCAPEEAPLVEGIMRVTYSTLDNLDRTRFRREAKVALQAARLDPDLARDTAKSYALLVPEAAP